MRHNLSASERHQPRRAPCKLRKIAHVQTPWIQTVTRQQHSCLAIVERDAQRIVSRNRYDVENALAKIDVSNSIRPFIDAEKLASAIHRKGNHGHIRHTAKPSVARDMIAVRMG